MFFIYKKCSENIWILHTFFTLVCQNCMQLNEDKGERKNKNLCKMKTVLLNTSKISF